jgi:hypothetical protein
VVDIELWPTRGPTGIRFGAVWYEGKVGELEWMVTMAPALVWTVLAGLALWWKAFGRGWLAKCGFLFLFLLPLTDIALQLGHLVTSRPEADYPRVLGGHPMLTALVAVPYFATFFWLGWRRLFVPIFGRAALSPAEYALALTITLMGIPTSLALLF